MKPKSLTCWYLPEPDGIRSRASRPECNTHCWRVVSSVCESNYQEIPIVSVGFSDHRWECEDSKNVTDLHLAQHYFKNLRNGLLLSKRISRICFTTFGRMTTSMNNQNLQFNFARANQGSYTLALMFSMVGSHLFTYWLLYFQTLAFIVY